MRKATPLRLSAILMAFLVVSLPLVFAEEMNLVHDRNGNLVSGDGNFRIYNSLNQLWKIHNETNEAGRLLEEYIYHPTEERVWVKKVYNASAEVAETTIYVSDTFVRVLNSSGTYDFAYIKHEGQLVAQVAAGGNTEFVHGDHLGSASVVTDSFGNAVENTSYEPFGGIVSGGSKTRFDYEGKEFDSVVGDYDFHFRKYIPGIGWAQPDTLIQNVYDPQSLNRYTFERNNPYNNVDPTGHVTSTVVGIGQTFGTTLVGIATVLFAPEVLIVAGVVVGVLILDLTIKSLNSNPASELPITEKTTGEIPPEITPFEDKLRGIEKQIDDPTLDGAKKEIEGRQDYRYPLDHPTKPGQIPDHIGKVQFAQRGLKNLIERLEKKLQDSRLSDPSRKALENTLKRVKDTLSKTEKYVPPDTPPSPSQPTSTNSKSGGTT